MKAWDRLTLPFLDRFRAAGFDPLTVDTVVCTHLHVDHVGCNTMLVDGEWRPTFPESRYLFAGPEHRHWSVEPHNRRPEHETRSSRWSMAWSISSTSTPRSRPASLCTRPPATPGRCSVRLSSNGSRALITGDSMHHAVQVADPGWCSRFDSDPVAGERTRRDFIDAHADTDLLVIGTHFGGPGAGHIVSVDHGQVLAPAG